MIIYIEYPDVLTFKEKLKNQTILDISRYGKWLMFLTDDYCLFSHLRMEGKYFIKVNGDERNIHEHVIFKFQDNTELRYMDVRKFGKMQLILKSDINKQGPIPSLGKEPWDKNLTVDYLKEKYLNRKLPIKSVLLDQKIIVGIGNIYADEILFLSNINPLKKANLLNDDELELIIKNTLLVLESAIKKGGSTIKSYTSVDGIHGLFQQELLVHCQEGKPCRNCGTKIEKIKVGSRSTYFCSNCQK